MSDGTYNLSKAVERFRCRDPTFKFIHLVGGRYTDLDLIDLVDCLLTYPDVLTHIYLGVNRLTDETGIKLARYLAVSSTIQFLYLNHNQFSLTTSLALAAALRINTSLRSLDIGTNLSVAINSIDKSRVDAAFVDALLLNPNRPVNSSWCLYSWNQNDFSRLKRTAEELGHPNMQALLTTQLAQVI